MRYFCILEGCDSCASFSKHVVEVLDGLESFAVLFLISPSVFKDEFAFRRVCKYHICQLYEILRNMCIFIRLVCIECSSHALVLQQGIVIDLSFDCIMAE